MHCELCEPKEVILENALAYVHFDSADPSGGSRCVLKGK